MGWTPDPEQRAALIRARELAQEMRIVRATWKTVADRLTADGYPTMHGTPWTYQMVQRLLRNPPPAEPVTKYTTRHWRVRDRRGPAKLLKCAHCAERGTDKQAYDWAHLHGTDAENVMHYIPLCRKCHIAYDKSGHRTPHTDEARAKMSEGQLRRYDEMRSRLADEDRTEDPLSPGGPYHYMPHTDEARAKMSESQRRAYAEGRKVGANTFQSGKTHCRNKHEYNDENTYVNPKGERVCRICRHDNLMRWKAKVKASRAASG